MSVNYYKVLNVDYSADFYEIKRAYYKQAKLCHPDLFGNSPEKNEEFKRVVLAFDVLSDPVKREEYDRKIGVIHLKGGDADVYEAAYSEASSIMDTPADDTLEELIVGNSPPENTTLATLMLDLKKTEVFILFREGKHLFSQQKYRSALVLFYQALDISPHNILYNYFTAKANAFIGEYGKSLKYYRTAIKIGERRIPPQKLLKIRKEFDLVQKKYFPIRTFLREFVLGPQKPKLIDPPDVEMTARTNRIINKILREQRQKRIE